jgi:hypothetical protein
VGGDGRPEVGIVAWARNHAGGRQLQNKGVHGEKLGKDGALMCWPG